MSALQSPVCVRRLERLCDAVVRLESFAGSDKEQSPLFKEYHGTQTIMFIACVLYVVTLFIIDSLL